MTRLPRCSTESRRPSRSPAFLRQSIPDRRTSRASSGPCQEGGCCQKGEGEFAVKAGNTTLEHGTFELTGLVAFQFYGCGYVADINLGDNSLCGGRALFTVHAVPSTGEPGDGLLEVNCQIHGPNNQPPPGTNEGIKVNARGINFNKHVTGDNLFVMLG